MHLKNSFKTALVSLAAHKSRSFLTILGIVIGIAAIILIMGLGQGAENLIVGELSSFGAELIVIRPGQEPSGPTDFASALFTDSLKTKDIEALKKKSNVPGLRSVVPELIVPGSVSFMGETYKPTIIGWSAEFMVETLNLYPEEGDIFYESDIQNKASVAILGYKVKQELFGDSDAVGLNIRIKDKNFRVIGVLPQKGQVSFFNVDEIVVLPYSTAQTYLLGIDYYHEIIVQAESSDVVDSVVLDIERTLRESHDIKDPTKDDFFVVTQEGIVGQISTIIGTLTLFLSLVVAVALVVGGIGVMNIMLVSVTERTREIGLRKALGATSGDILRQFLLEAVILTAVGGVIGIALGAAGSFLIAVGISSFTAYSWPFAFPILGAVLGLGVSAGVGLAFGLYPAKQASDKSPIEALRYE